VFPGLLVHDLVVAKKERPVCKSSDEECPDKQQGNQPEGLRGTDDGKFGRRSAQILQVDVVNPLTG
jgi:hypothetical protein